MRHTSVAPVVGLLVVLFAALAGCSTLSPQQRAASETVENARSAYASGEYSRTIQLLSHASEIDQASRPIQIEAHKLMAFSYCVTNRVSACRAEFKKILNIDPNFELSAAERGHPIWGPAFEAARRQRGASS
ncbi:TssQ family T6SS-associated lipoprotein [Paraburkholderia sp. PGU19]|uniref:TssQ family T6SS-associated lipoprotein n=1 Tax=Paraburkholderia sp. PGU19 TaxID=2735434 RepID=UPI0015DA3D04|nr:TssQ family T6SS-associated lipoprotein [Paraburkholderia sp. PGU19]